MPDVKTAAQLADDLVIWVEGYAAKVCPDGCLPTMGQEREITLFASIVRALRAAPAQCDVQTKEHIVRVLKANLKIGGHDAWEGHYYFVDGIEAAADALLSPSVPSAERGRE